MEPAIFTREGSTPAAAFAFEALAFNVSTDMSLVPRSSRNDRAASGATRNKCPIPGHTGTIMVNGGLRIGGPALLRLSFVVTGDLVYLFHRHLAGDVAHLLADIIAAGPGRKGLKLGLDIDRRLAAEPGTAGLVVDVAMAGAAGRDVAHRRPRGDDLRRSELRVQIVRGHPRQIGIIGRDI